MDWSKVKYIQESINRLEKANISKEAKVTLMLNGKEVCLHSIGTDKDGNVIVQLDQD